MFRLSQYLNAVHDSSTAASTRGAVRNAGKPNTGPVVIWNLVRRCNLTCKHCYATSADKDFPGELSTRQVMDTMDDLKPVWYPRAYPVRW